MPFKSKAQEKKFFVMEENHEIPKGTAKRWAHHTKNIKDLPEHVKHKKAFIAGFLLKCAAEGITDPLVIAERAEILAASREKMAEGGTALGNALGGVAGAVGLGGALGIALPTALGYGLGRTGGVIRNQADSDDAETLRMAAMANAYRRRAAEARQNAQVQKIIESDPKHFVRIG